MSFKAKNGIQIIPLDANPQFLLLKEIKQIRIDIEDNSTKEFEIKYIKLFQRKIVDVLELNKTIEIFGNRNITPYPLTDINWINGFARSGNGFFLNLKEYNFFGLKKNDILLINNNENKIIKIQFNGEFVNIFLEKPIQFQNVNVLLKK